MFFFLSSRQRLLMIAIVKVRSDSRNPGTGSLSILDVVLFAAVRGSVRQGEKEWWKTHVIITKSHSEVFFFLFTGKKKL